MRKLRFMRDYDFRASPNSVMAFKKNYEGNVTEAAADAALEAGAAEAIDGKDTELGQAEPEAGRAQENSGSAARADQPSIAVRRRANR